MAEEAVIADEDEAEVAVVAEEPQDVLLLLRAGHPHLHPIHSSRIQTKAEIIRLLRS